MITKGLNTIENFHMLNNFFMSLFNLFFPTRILQNLGNGSFLGDLNSILKEVKMDMIDVQSLPREIR